MEAGAEFVDPERLEQFLDRVLVFLAETTRFERVGVIDERSSLRSAVAEFREVQLVTVVAELVELSPEDAVAAGFSPYQAEFKMTTAERAMQEALEPTARGMLRPKRILRAIQKVRVVVASLKGLSRWLEALDELLAMVGEITRNRLGVEPQ